MCRTAILVLSGFLEGTCYATFYGMLLLHYRLVKHMAKYLGLEIPHMTMNMRFQKSSKVVSNGKTTI